jgi:hypothetical protein
VSRNILGGANEMRKFKVGLGLLIAAVMLLGMGGVGWGVPNSINLQGRLTGDPLPTYVKFTVYEGGDATSGGTIRWSRDFPVITTGSPTGFQVLVDPTSRIFNIVLQTGSAPYTTTLPEFTTDTYYLEIAAYTGTAWQPLTPRQPLVSVPYAITAKNVRGGTIQAESSTAGISAIWASSRSTSGAGNGVEGSSMGSGAGVKGTNTAALAVTGVKAGVEGTSSTGPGVQGTGTSNSAPGVKGINNSDLGYGVHGEAVNGYGVYGKSASATTTITSPWFGVGVFGINYASSYIAPEQTTYIGTLPLKVYSAGIFGQGDGTVGITGFSKQNVGIYGTSNASNKAGVYATNQNTTSPGLALEVAGKIKVSQSEIVGISTDPTTTPAGVIKIFTGSGLSFQTLYNSCITTKSIIILTQRSSPGGLRTSISQKGTGYAYVLCDRATSQTTDAYVDYLVIN